MRCANYHSRLQAQLDGEAQGDPLAVDRHLRACPDCRRLDNAAQRFREGLLVLTSPCPPADLSSQIVGRLLRDRARTRRRKVVAWSALAAGLLIALGMGRVWSRLVPAKPDPRRPVEIHVATSERSLPPLRLRESVTQASSAVAALTSQAADETVGHTRILLPSMPGGALDVAVLAPVLETPTQSLRQAGHGVSEGLEPIADSARRAVGLFLRDLPIEKSTRPPF